jgi:type IV pilus assembly protein PilO
VARFALPMGLSGPKQQMATRVAAGALLVSLVAAAFYLFVYADLADRIEKQKREEKSLAGQLVESKKGLESYQRDLAELAQLQRQQRELNAILPETTEYPAFLSAVQGVANISGVALQSWTPQDEVVQKYFARVPMRLSLTGKYHQIARFFCGVGQLDRIINVENIALSQVKNQADEATLKAECLATSFHSLPTRPAGSGAAPTGKP